MEKKVNPKILVVEDAFWHHMEIKSMILERIPQAEIIHASNRAEADRFYRQNEDIDLIVADIDINQENEKTLLDGKFGLSFMEDVHSNNKQLPLIAYTIFDDADTQARLDKIKAEYVKKYSFGVPPRTLITVIIKKLQ